MSGSTRLAGSSRERSIQLGNSKIEHLEQATSKAKLAARQLLTSFEDNERAVQEVAAAQIQLEEAIRQTKARKQVSLQTKYDILVELFPGRPPRPQALEPSARLLEGAH